MYIISLNFHVLNSSTNSADSLAEIFCSDEASTAAVLLSMVFPAAGFVFGRLSDVEDANVFVAEGMSTDDDAVCMESPLTFNACSLDIYY